MSAGLVYALGNVALGINLSEKGIMAAGFPGPIAALILIIYRLHEACKIKKRIGTFVDKEHSNYWCEVAPSSPQSQINEADDEHYKAITDNNDSNSTKPEYRLNWSNINLVITTQALPSLTGLIIVAYAFKFATLAEMN